MATTNTTLALLLAARAVEAGDIISGRNGTASHRPSFGSQRLPGSLEYVLTRAPLEGSLDPAGGRSLFGVGQPAAFASHNIIMSRSVSDVILKCTIVACLQNTDPFYGPPFRRVLGLSRTPLLSSLPSSISLGRLGLSVKTQEWLLRRTTTTL